MSGVGRGLGREQQGWVAWRDAFELAAERKSFEGPLPLAVFVRLGAMIDSPGGEVQATLDFAHDNGQVRVSGHCSGSVQLICQRCLDPFTQHFDSGFELLLVASEAELAQLSGLCDVELITDRLRPLDFIEDEVIMALPLVPRHADVAQCGEVAARAQATGAT